MITYLDRKVVVRTQEGDYKQVTRHVIVRNGKAVARYQNGVQHIRCNGNAQDKNALWLVVS